MPSADRDRAVAEVMAAVEELRRAVETLTGRSSPASSSFATLSRAYGDDADAERAAGRSLGYTAFALLVLALVIGIAGIVDAREASGFRSDAFWAYALVSVVVLAAAALLFWQAAGRRRTALEARRLERQLQGIEPYLAELPRPLRDLLRGTLASSVFPPPADEEPWRQPRWPEPALMLEAVRPPAASEDDVRPDAD